MYKNIYFLFLNIPIIIIMFLIKYILMNETLYEYIKIHTNT